MNAQMWDFVIVERRQPLRFIECRLGDRDVDPALKDLAKCLPHAQAWQISLDGTTDSVAAGGIRVAPALALLRDPV